jgi:hypothetical protein
MPEISCGGHHGWQPERGWEFKTMKTEREEFNTSFATKT